ncbi:transcriptional regulator [Sporanaerobium hydrogeniformans]|uniref:Transcriptional regulator n=1 Tax=Sporanaerobium hydrogeniformans TaxID=3072179 RepID=A0AC61DDF7_9FIRM|nr:PadR family transcriptional regulator [Sporanaerobium hydrogeniformans]PHV71244.1 transcriptional regulator [Sporanaerobium hydrogeniformans]
MKEIDSKCACKGSTLVRFIQPIILASLCEGPNHGYNLIEKISQTTIWQGNSPDATGIYRILRDMEKRGLVKSYVEAETRAAIGKRVFSITEEGRQCIGNWIHTLRQYNEGIKDIITRLEPFTPEIEKNKK